MRNIEETTAVSGCVKHGVKYLVTFDNGCTLLLDRPIELDTHVEMNVSLYFTYD